MFLIDNPFFHRKNCPKITTGIINNAWVIPAKTAASDLEVLEYGMSSNVSRAIISNSPIPPGVIGIEAPKLTIPVIIIEDSIK